METRLANRNKNNGIPNHVLNQKVISSKGIVSIDELLCGDYVYNAYTGKSMMVVESKPISFDTCYEARYTSGRRMSYHRDQQIVWDNRMTANNSFVTSLATAEILSSSSMRPDARIDMPRLTITNHNVDINITKRVDPYVAGPFLVYGDMEKSYLNLPSCLFEYDPYLFSEFLNYIKIVYPFIDKMVIVGEDVKFYNDSCRVITWADLFGEQELSSLNPIDEAYILMKYIYTDEITRLRLVRGVFDLGYNPILSSDRGLMINGEYFENIDALVNILASLGVIAKMHFIPKKRYMFYPIEIVHGNIAELFYNRKVIGEAINHQTILMFRHKIKYVKAYTKLMGYNVVLEKKYRNKPFLSSYFLPIISADY